MTPKPMNATLLIARLLVLRYAMSSSVPGGLGKSRAMERSGFLKKMAALRAAETI